LFKEETKDLMSQNGEFAIQIQAELKMKVGFDAKRLHKNLMAVIGN